MPQDDDPEEMVRVGRDEFKSLKREVRNLQDQVEANQDQIAKLRSRTRVDPEPNKSSSDPVSESGTEIPSSPIERTVVQILREEAQIGNYIEVEEIKQQAVVEDDFLRSRTKNVVRKLIDSGYLAGDLDGEVKVVEWPADQ